MTPPEDAVAQGVNDQGAVNVPVNDWHDGRTLLPQYQNSLQDSTNFDDAETDIASLAAITDKLDLEDNTGEEGSSPSRAPNHTGDPTWDRMFCDPSWRKMHYISCCIYKDISELEALFHHYPNDNFVGYADEEGNTGTMFAATEENGLETLRWLYSHGGPFDQANH